MTPYIVSHWRTGTHALASLLYDNLHIDVDNYERLHYSHTRIPEFPFVAVWRPALPTAVSFWKMRRSFGVHASVTFAQMLTQPLESLPQAEPSAILLNGVERPSPVKSHTGMWLDRWLTNTRKFCGAAAVVVQYSAIQERPLEVLRAIGQEFRLTTKSQLKLPLGRVGWTPIEDEVPDVTWELLKRLEMAQAMLINSWASKPVHVWTNRVQL